MINNMADTKETNSEEYTTITNTQYYNALTPGITYKMHYYLADPIKDPYTHQLIGYNPIYDENNNLKYEDYTLFVPDAPSGSIELSLTMKTSEVDDKEYCFISEIELESTAVEAVESGLGISHTTSVIAFSGLCVVIVALLTYVVLHLIKQKKQIQTIKYLNDIGDFEKMEIEEINNDDYYYDTEANDED